MCGIAGYIAKTAALDPQLLQSFTEILHHRGPDARGTFSEGNVGLAHTRLSILDTSCNANQPFTSSNGRYTIVFNGEIYNFKELQKRVSVPLKTTSDTEVLVELFAEEGEKCLSSLRGMFAFAIYDRKERSLCIARDRLGIKPLYVYQTEEVFMFSSELKALAAIPEVKKRLTLNRSALQNYLHLGFVPSESTLYHEIQKFPSATVTTIRADLSKVPNPYWKITDYIHPIEISFTHAKEKLRDLLYQAVEEHLISDVPVGLFLSGGTDSSLLAAIANKIQPNGIKTFTLGFSGTKDEAPHAKKIANYLGTEHYEHYLTLEESIGILHQLQHTYDEPFADTSAIPTMCISSLAAQKVKVVLSGEGADELFLGYNTHNWAKRATTTSFKAAKPVLSFLSKMVGEPRLQKAAAYASKLSTPYLAGAIYSAEHGFYTADEISLLTHSPYKGYRYTKHADALYDQILFDLEVGLQDGLLVKMDRATMRFGLEARVPFLDHRLVEFALSLNVRHRLWPNKHILKEILYELIPKELLNRDKWGFGLDSRNELREYLRQKAELGGDQSIQKLFCSYHLPQGD